MTKKESRRILQKIWNGMEKDRLETLSVKVCARILGSREWRNASVILAYLSFGKELNLDEVIKESLRAGKTVGVPLIESGTEMTFRRLTEWNPSLFISNKWGIREPEKAAPLLQKKEIGLILVPGLGFSEDGRRMGRGGGYYDRYLQSPDLKNTALMGISCEACLTENIPVEKHDRTVHSICTESRIIRL